MIYSYIHIRRLQHTRLRVLDTYIFITHTHALIKYSTAVSHNISVLLWPTVLIYHYIFLLTRQTYTQQYIYVCNTIHTQTDHCTMYIFAQYHIYYICVFFSFTTGTSARVRIRAKLKHISQRSAIIETNQDSLSNGEWSGK